ncbi:MAG: SPOR domain-containing protein [Bacteroidales bacterium]
MNKIINDLLNTNARVIIPDFGAFIIKQKSPRLVVFNEFLRYNDGLLVDYFSASEGISKDVARSKLAKYVEDINSRLNSGEEIVFEGIGKLIKESNGKLSLADISAAETSGQKKEKKNSVTTPTDERDKDKTRKKEEDEKEPSAIPEVKADRSPEPVNIKKEETMDKSLPVEQKTEIELSVEKEESKPSQPEKVVAPKEEKITVTPIKTTREKETPVKPQPVQKSVEQKTQKSKSNTAQIVIWILLILVVNGLIISWFVFNDKITDMFGKNKNQTTEEIVPADESPELSAEEYAADVAPADLSPEGSNLPAAAPTSQLEERAADKPAITGDRKFYYIVAGCFREEGNADKLAEELKQNGYNARKFGIIGNLHAVSFNAFADKTDALKELKKIRNTGNAEAWIIYY